MTKKVTVINRKGGACKTTTAVNIAAALGLKGYKVLAIDLDPQADLTAYLLPNDLSEFKTLTDGFDKQDLSICVYPSTAENVDVIPADEKLDRIDNQLRQDELGILQLSDLFGKLDSSKYDYVILDSAPERTRLSSGALVLSDTLIMPIESYASYKKIATMFKEFKRIKETVNPKLHFGHILITVAEPQTNFFKELETIKEHEAIKGMVLETVIPKNITFKECMPANKSIFSHNPHSSGAEAYMKVTEELIKKWEGSND